MVLTITGCSAKRYTPAYTQLLENTKIKQDTKIKLYNQEFDYPEPTEVSLVRLYPSSHLKGRMGENINAYNWDDVPRNIDNQTFCFTKTGSRRFDIPYFSIKFKSPMIIRNILIYHTEVAYNDKKQKIDINPSLYLLKDKDRMKNQYVFSKASREKYKLSERIDANTSIRIDSIGFKRSKALKQIFLAFDDLQDLSPTKYIDMKKNPTIKIDGYSVSGVVLSALKTRTDKSYNEKLVREVGFKNAKLFRMIQKKAKTLNLPKSSVAHLPRDISIKYGLKNHAKILKTGRYMTYNGKYKHLKNNNLFKSSYKYNPNHTIKVKGEKATIKKSSSSHKTAGFLDLSNGI